MHVIATKWHCLFLLELQHFFWINILFTLQRFCGQSDISTKGQEATKSVIGKPFLPRPNSKNKRKFKCFKRYALFS